MTNFESIPTGTLFGFGMAVKLDVGAARLITFELDGVGEIAMVGIGPWKTVGVGSTREIRDSNNVVANPTVVQKWSTVTKPNRNVIFAKAATAEAIVAKANELLAA